MSFHVKEDTTETHKAFTKSRSEQLLLIAFLVPVFISLLGVYFGITLLSEQWLRGDSKMEVRLLRNSQATNGVEIWDLKRRNESQRTLSAEQMADIQRLQREKDEALGEINSLKRGAQSQNDEIVSLREENATLAQAASKLAAELRRHCDESEKL
ncbi:hypothetical protein BU16DRAFT_561469 [Lophium mytilinum]|uniref:Uncharacterized protein n=1 Tax=Lophium mytilinum TaxID=390894 RepID=A0A6A6QSP0_9PEZI|nr:hypothetical protein BU16DRAFT_561469 [Lophium mytilinum]